MSASHGHGKHVVLFHGDGGVGRRRAGALRAAGYRVGVRGLEGGDAPRALRAAPPDAVIVDLSRIPSHGRAIGVSLRQAAATRRIPLLFVGGAPDKVARTRELLPDAVYSGWGRIRGDLRRALARPPASPAVPGTMADYSGVPLVRKLGIRPGSTVALVAAPTGFEATLGELPQGARSRRGARGRAERVLLFARSRAELRRRYRAAMGAVAEGGGLWILWPKRSSALAGDLDQGAVRSFGLGAGAVDYKICAVDDTWSGLLFARRRRPA